MPLRSASASLQKASFLACFCIKTDELLSSAQMKSSFIEVCVSKVAWKLFLAVFEVSGTLNFISSIVDHVFSSEGYSSLFV